MNYEQWLAALCIWREARGEAYQVKLGVWWVIQNRVNDTAKRWPRSIAGVILQHDQFSSFLHSDPNVTRFPMPPTDPLAPSGDWSAFGECQKAVSEPGQADPSNGANMYESLPEDAEKPAWATPEAMTAHLGTVRFYRL